MKSLLTAVALGLLWSLAPCVRAHAQVAGASPVPPAPIPERVQPLSMAATLTAQSPPPAPGPKLKLSYVRHGSGDGGTVLPSALHLDMYALSWRWLRTGFDVEAGHGRGTLQGNPASVNYGLLGVNLGLRIPQRFSPFVEGRLAGGLLAARTDGALMIPGTAISVNGAGGATWMYTRGIDLGIEVLTFGRGYLALAVGWMRTTWRGAALDDRYNLVPKDISYDGYLLKLGLGI